VEALHRAQVAAALAREGFRRSRLSRYRGCFSASMTAGLLWSLSGLAVVDEAGLHCLQVLRPSRTAAEGEGSGSARRSWESGASGFEMKRTRSFAGALTRGPATIARKKSGSVRAKFDLGRVKRDLVRDLAARRHLDLEENWA